MPATYAGIGSRRAPVDVNTMIFNIGAHAASKNWTLRSGAASGCDSSFEQGCDSVQGKKEIFLPWTGYNNRYDGFLSSPSPLSFKFASAIHPVYERLSVVTKKLIARNMHIILGKTLDDPVDFVVCWTPDGCEDSKHYTRKTGGTGTAISLASLLHIPVYNVNHRYHNPFDLFK